MTVSATTTTTRRVAVVGPCFGSASAAVARALRLRPGCSLVAEHWYSEAAYERPVGRVASRVLRTSCELLGLSNRTRERVESVGLAWRLQRARAAMDIVEQVRSFGEVDVVVLIKPVFLQRADVEQIRSIVGGAMVVIILWDALWRTPGIRDLVPLVDAVFTTEPTDCGGGIRLLPVPGAPPSPSTFPVATDPVGPALFFCGAASVARVVNAIALKREADRQGVGSQLVLVADNKLAARLIRSLGLAAEALDADEYHRALSRCVVVVDLGRTGQSSPSERLADAVLRTKPFLTANATFAGSSYPIVAVKRFRRAFLVDAVPQALAAGRDCSWVGSEEALRFVISPSEWAATVIGEAMDVAALS